MIYIANNILSCNGHNDDDDDDDYDAKNVHRNNYAVSKHDDYDDVFISNIDSKKLEMNRKIYRIAFTSKNHSRSSMSQFSSRRNSSCRHSDGYIEDDYYF